MTVPPAKSESCYGLFNSFEPMLVTVFRGFLGILALIFIAYLFSRNRRAVDWTQIAVALLLQLVLGVAILYVPFVGNFIEVLGVVSSKFSTLRTPARSSCSAIWSM